MVVSAVSVTIDLWLLAIGVALFVIATAAAVRVKRRLDAEGRNEQAAGLTMTVMIVNILQLMAVVLVLTAIFGRP